MTVAPPLHDRVVTAAESVRARTTLRPEIAIVLGTGLGGLAREIDGRGRDPVWRDPGVPALDRGDPRGQAPGRHGWPAGR